MRSEKLDVDDYLETVPEARRPALVRLREISVATLVGYEESMDYGMPSYRRPGQQVEIAFASQARYISLYILRQDVLDRFRPELAAANVGKGCVRYTTPARIDFEVVQRLLEASSESSGPIC